MHRARLCNVFIALFVLAECTATRAAPDRGPTGTCTERRHRHRYSEEVLQDALRSKAEVKSMIDEAFDAYMTYAFPADELVAADCSGVDTLGSYSLTLIDSLDTLVLVGRHDDFRKHSKWIVDNVNPDKNVTVSVFETNIRIVGGLLAAHFLYEEGIVQVDPEVDDYNGGLLRLAIAFADRLLPAFMKSKTGIPFGSVNLKYGVLKGEVDETATASATTFSVEFTILSAVTNNPKYERAARKATRAVYKYRTKRLGLVGNHINVTDGRWTIPQFSVGTGVDSYFEYLLKTYLLTGDLEYFAMYRTMNDALEKYSRKGPWYVTADSKLGSLVHPLHNSLASFYPGALVLTGQLRKARESIEAAHFIFKRYGAMPEGYHLNGNGLVPGQLGYPLRPEHVESIYHQYRATQDPSLLRKGQEVILALKQRTKTRCGYVSLNNVALPIRSLSETYAERMDSFLISETLKYLYLLFDVEEDAFLHRRLRSSTGTTQPSSTGTQPSASGTDSGSSGSSAGGDGAGRDQQQENTDSTIGPPNPQWIFNTEGHFLPVTAEWSTDAYYDRRNHRCSAGLPAEGHPLSGMKLSDLQCPPSAPQIPFWLSTSMQRRV